MEELLFLDKLFVRFNTYAGRLNAVNGMSFHINRQEIFGLVGESGCGKSVTGLAILRMVPPPGQITSGRILYRGKDLLQMNEKELQSIRGRNITMIFQDPSATLNPVFTCGNQITRLIRLHTSLSEKKAREKAIEMLDAVALPDPRHILRCYPHELSGGMQQRVMIAMALASGTELLIADEPTTALDVTIQAQILKLLADVREHRGISILLITHNLGIVAEICDRVAVAYAGSIVEMGTTEEILYEMKHPYTQGLLSAVPTPSQKGKPLTSIEGSVPDGLDAIQGCSFKPRCSHAMQVCNLEQPALSPLGDRRHFVACHLYQSETVN
jgi:oligopeptide/dipeptide ABC transporter ATP-binding protein